MVWSFTTTGSAWERKQCLCMDLQGLLGSWVTSGRNHYIHWGMSQWCVHAEILSLRFYRDTCGVARGVVFVYGRKHREGKAVMWEIISHKGGVDQEEWPRQLCYCPVILLDPEWKLPSALHELTFIRRLFLSVQGCFLMKIYIIKKQMNDSC